MLESVTARREFQLPDRVNYTKKKQQDDQTKPINIRNKFCLSAFRTEFKGCIPLSICVAGGEAIHIQGVTIPPTHISLLQSTPKHKELGCLLYLLIVFIQLLTADQLRIFTVQISLLSTFEVRERGSDSPESFGSPTNRSYIYLPGKGPSPSVKVLIIYTRIINCTYFHFLPWSHHQRRLNMHKSVSPKLVNISKCHLVETKIYLFIYLPIYLFIFPPKLDGVERQIQLYPTTFFQPGHWAASHKSLILNQGKSRLGLEFFGHMPYTP